MATYMDFLSKGTEYVISGQRTGQSVMNAFRDVVEKWEVMFVVGDRNIRTESGVMLPDVWEISGEHPDINLWFEEAERLTR